MSSTYTPRQTISTDESSDDVMTRHLSEYALGRLDAETLLARAEELFGRCLWASDEELPELRAKLDRTYAVARKRRLVSWNV